MAASGLRRQARPLMLAVGPLPAAKIIELDSSQAHRMQLARDIVWSVQLPTWCLLYTVRSAQDRRARRSRARRKQARARCTASQKVNRRCVRPRAVWHASRRPAWWRARDACAESRHSTKASLRERACNQRTAGLRGLITMELVRLLAGLLDAACLQQGTMQAVQG